MKIKLRHKRGIRIQTRYIVSALLLLIQLVFLIRLLFNISAQSAIIYRLTNILAVFTVICIVNRRGNPSYKIAWIIFILIFPVFGVPAYLLWGGGRIMPFFRKKMTACEQHYLPKLSLNEELIDQLRYHDLLHSRQADYLMRESGYPLYKNSDIEYLSPGEAFFPRFLEELEKAEKYIFIEFFIVAEGEMFDAVYDVLRRKASAGIEVKLLFDDFGSIKRQHKDFIKRLRKDGIGVAVFNKIGPSLNLFMNNRNHRKIVVIDGKVAATGGLNLADEYINAVERFGYWMDCAVLIKGEAVKSFVAMFCSMWEFTTGKALDMDSYLAESTIQNDCFVLPYCDDPLNDKNPAEGIYMQIINTARKYVYIASPYLIIDSTMIALLSIAAKSGIDVRIITPHIPDKWYVHPVTQYNYKELLEAGVRIYEYTPGFIHSKLFVSDDSVATVGTVNMDYRSLVLHFECGVWMCKTDAVLSIREQFEELFKVSQEITAKEWSREPWYRRLKRAILNIFSPFL